MTVPSNTHDQDAGATVPASQSGALGSDAPQAAEVGPAPPPQHPISVATADHILTLVSGCVVNQRAFANTCGVPLGGHLDFAPPAALRLPRVARPPARCSGCSAFLSVYCKTNLLKWVWKCAMCGTVNISREQLGHSADVASYPELCNEAVEFVLPAPPAPPPGPAAAAPNAAAASRPMGQAEGPAQGPAPHLVFVVDTSMEAADLQAVKHAITACAPSLPPATLLSLVTCDGCVALHSLGQQRAAHVLPAGPLDQAAVQGLVDAYHSPEAAADPAAGGAGGAAGGVLFAAAGVLGPQQLQRALGGLRSVGQREVPLRQRARCLLPAIEAALRLVAAAGRVDPAAAAAAAPHSQSPPAGRVVVFAGGPPTRGAGALPTELLDQAVPEKGRSPDSKAVAAALDAGSALGAMAASIGVAVDIFATTANGINAPLLSAIALGSGGELAPQYGIPPHVRYHPAPHGDLSAGAASAANGGGAGGSLNSGGGAGGSGGGSFVGALLAHQLGAALGRRFGLDGRLDCYCSDGLRLVQWMGPLEAIKDEPDEPAASASSSSSAAPRPAQPPPATASAATASAAASTASTVAAASAVAVALRLSPAACGVGTVEAGRGAALRLEVTRDLQDTPFLVLQVALHFTDPATGQRLVRLVSRRLAVVASLSDFLRSVNPTAAAALLGKRAVLDAKKAGAFRDARRAEEARLAVAAQLALVATRCGKEVQAGRGMLGFGGKKLRQWPPELMPLAYALYHFQRGPLLGPAGPPPPGTAPPASHAAAHALWDADARLAAMNCLLRSGWSDAYRAMAPKLYALLPPAAAPPPPVPEPSMAPAVVQQQQPLQLAALPCVSLAAVMARTVPLLLDCGVAVLVSPTEEPLHGAGGGGAAGAAGGPQAAGAGGQSQAQAHWQAQQGLTGQLLEAAAQVVGYGPGAAGGAAGRFPVPAVVLAPGAQAGHGGLAARLIPVHRDGYEEQAMQHPQLQQLGQAVAAQLSKQLLEGGAAATAAACAGLPPAAQKQVAAAAASFVEWCRGVNVRPFPLLR